MGRANVNDVRVVNSVIPGSDVVWADDFEATLFKWTLVAGDNGTTARATNWAAFGLASLRVYQTNTGAVVPAVSRARLNLSPASRGLLALEFFIYPDTLNANSSVGFSARLDNGVDSVGYGVRLRRGAGATASWEVETGDGVWTAVGAVSDAVPVGAWAWVRVLIDTNELSYEELVVGSATLDVSGASLFSVATGGTQTHVFDFRVDAASDQFDGFYVDNLIIRME